MKIKVVSMFVALVVVSNVFSQSNLNDYKYVIVPNKFDFLREKDEYQLNSLAAFLFKKYGFIALREGETYPSDLSSNRCLALRSDVIKDSGLFKTKLNVELKDCNDRIVFTSEVGQSREKEFKKAYVEAMRNAFKSFEGVAYTYSPKKNDVVVITQPEAEDKSQVAQEIQKLKQEIQTLKQKKDEQAVTSIPVTAKEKEVVNERTAVITEISPVVKNGVPTKEATPIKEKATSNILYAQEIENGFQLVDSTPKVVYRILESGAQNVFFVENKSAIVYKNGENWVLEYYSGGSLKQETLNIKF